MNEVTFTTSAQLPGLNMWTHNGAVTSKWKKHIQI